MVTEPTVRLETHESVSANVFAGAAGRSVPYPAAVVKATCAETAPSATVTVELVISEAS